MNDSTKFFITHIYALSIALFVLIFVFPVGGKIDLNLIQPWINKQAIFYLKDNWTLAILNHQYIKWLLILFDLTIMSYWLISFFNKKFRHLRWNYGYFFILTIASVVLIGVLKSFSTHSCPWDMVMVSKGDVIWNLEQGNGRCFPGGHASSGFALMAGFFVFRISKPNQARLYLYLGIILGLGLGWSQMMRGAHFMSHNLWTGWIIWLLNVICYRVFYARFDQLSYGSKFNYKQ